MQQGTLSNILQVKDTGLVLKEFEPDSAIGLWLSKAKTKGHILSKTSATSSSAIHSLNDTTAVGEEELEDDNMLPPLPHLVDESDDTVEWTVIT